MRILFLGDWKRDDASAQDMLDASLRWGLARAFGSVNVCDVFRHTQFRGADWAMRDWPVFLGSTIWYGQPDGTPGWIAGELENRAWLSGFVSGFDAAFVSVQFMSGKNHLAGACLSGIRDSRIPSVVFDGSDCPTSRDDWREFLGDCVRLICRRPCDVLGGFVPSMIVHISVPLEHIWRMQAMADVYPCRKIFLHASMSDNHPFRRELMARLASSNIPDRVLRWGSATGHAIEGTEGPIAPPYYLKEIESATVCVAARGGNQDTLRQTEILALGSLLLTDDRGVAIETLKDSENCLMYESTQDCLDKLWWVRDHPEDAKRIAANGKRLYLEYESPSQQAVRIMRKANLLS